MEKHTAFDYVTGKKSGEVDVAITLGTDSKMSGFTLDTNSAEEVRKLVAGLKLLYTHPELRNVTFFLSEKDRGSTFDQALKAAFTGPKD